MGVFEVCLVKRKRRQRTQNLIEFFTALSLFLRVGWDIGHAWREALHSLQPRLGTDMKHFLALDGDGLAPVWKRLSAEYPDAEHRLWFTALEKLHQNGAAMGDAVNAIVCSLRNEQSCDLDGHCRTLPARTNILLILFFLPPTLILLLFPLALEIGVVLAQ